MSKTALITGASSGFGKATAEKFAEAGYNLIITGRRKERLDDISAELQQRHDVKIISLAFDIQDKDDCFTAIKTLSEEWQEIDVLVNNAGLALGRDLFQDSDLADWEIMINTNLKGLLYITKAVLPVMIKRNRGHIINLGSIAGKESYERGNVYCATKAAVASLSKSLRIDLLPHGIKVTAIHPGAALTEFGVVRFKGNEENANKVYQGYQPLLPDDVADVILYCALQPDHVCINDLELTCLAQANTTYTYKQ